MDKELNKYSRIIHKVLYDFKITTDYEDHYQELMIVLWQKLETYDDTKEATIVTYLYSVLKNALINHQAKMYKTNAKPRDIYIDDILKSNGRLKILIDNSLYGKGDYFKRIKIELVKKKTAVLSYKGIMHVFKIGDNLRSVKHFKDSMPYEIVNPKFINEMTYSNQTKIGSNLDIVSDINMSLDFESFLNTLKPLDKKLVLLKIEGHSQEDIGKLLNRSRQTISRRLGNIHKLYIKFIE